MRLVSPRLVSSLFVAAAAAGLASCAGEREMSPVAQRAPSGVNGWVSVEQRNHDLVGKIWRPAEQEFVAREDLASSVEDARILLLGGRHENVDHHMLQAWMLNVMIADGRNPAVAMQMLTPEQQDRLSAYLQSNPRNARGIGSAVGWEETGWPYWQMYQPVAQVALDGGAALVPAGIGQGALHQVAASGPLALGEDQAASLGLAGGEVPGELLESMRHALAASRCPQMAAGTTDSMATTAIVEDARMAQAVLQGLGHEGRDSAVLIAGDSDLRTDIGVPWHIASQAPGERALSVAMIEVQLGMTVPTQYAPEMFGTDVLPFDYVWFTPRAGGAGPCDRFGPPLLRVAAGGTSG